MLHKYIISVDSHEFSIYAYNDYNYIYCNSIEKDICSFYFSEIDNGKVDKGIYNSSLRQKVLSKHLNRYRIAINKYRKLKILE